MNDQELVTLWLGSFRYYLGRQSYAVSSFCELLIQQWDVIPVHCQNLIHKELEWAFEKDAEGQPYLLGMDCDRAEWEKVRLLWAEKEEAIAND